MKLTVICGTICLALGLYQIVSMFITFFQQKKGTEVQKLDAVTAFGGMLGARNDAKLQILYCAADWIDVAKAEKYGLIPKDIMILAYWVEILSGEHSRLNEEQTSLSKTHVDMAQRRTLNYLRELETADDRWWQQNVIDFIQHFSYLPITEEPVRFSAAQSAALNYKMPVDLLEYIRFQISEGSEFLADDRYLNAANLKKLQDQFGSFTEENVKKMLLELSFNPLIDEPDPEIEIRYGQVCHKISLKPGKIMEVVLKKQLTMRAELMPTHRMPLERVEKYSVFPGGVHLSAYIGGMVPVLGGDEDTQFRSRSAIPCFNGGYIYRRNPSGLSEADIAYYNPGEPKPMTAGKNCGNKCVDTGDEVDTLWELIYIDIERQCLLNPECSRSLENTPSNSYTKRNTQIHDGQLIIGCGSQLSSRCTYCSCFDCGFYLAFDSANENVTGGPCANKAYQSSPPEAEGIAFINYLSQYQECPNSPANPRYEEYKAKNVPIGFGKRMTVSTYTLHTKVHTMLSTRFSECIDNSGKDEVQPIYQATEKCAAVCQDKILFDNCTTTSLLLSQDTGPDKMKLPLCNISQFWLGMESLMNEKAKQISMKNCVSECGKVPPLCRTATTSLTPEGEMYEEYKTNSTLYNYHKLVISAMEVEVATEFLQLPWDSFVANTGGLLGFFLGMSLLQWCLWPFACYAWLKNKRKQRQECRRQEKNIS